MLLQFETASKRFYSNQNVPVLLCLCRAWHAKANKDQSFSTMTTALQYAQKVMFSREALRTSADPYCI